MSDEDMSKSILANFHRYYRKGEIIEEDQDPAAAAKSKFNVDF